MNSATAVDSLFRLFGYARARVSGDLDLILSVLEDCGAVKCGESGLPTVSTHYRFRVRDRKITVAVEDYEDIMMTGPKAIIDELSKRISERMSRQ